MIFTKAEIEVLRLCAWCKDLPVNNAEIIPAEIIEGLLGLGLIRLSNSELSLRVTPLGYSLLQKIGYEYLPDKQYLGKSPALYRRLHTAEMTCFFWRMGIDVFAQSPPAEKDYTGFLPSFALRRKNASNILGGTRLGGFGYMGNSVFIPYYLEPDNDGIYAEVEQRTFRAESLSKGKRPFVIYTGSNNLTDIIDITLQEKEKSKKCTTDSYRGALSKFSAPVALVPLSINGIRQLRILSKPDYRKRLMRAVLGKDYFPPVKEQADGWSNTIRESYMIGIDCNLERFECILNQSKKPHIIILDTQAEAIGRHLMGRHAILHPLETSVVEKILNIEENNLNLHTVPFQTEKGEYIEASIIRQIKAAGR